MSTDAYQARFGGLGRLYGADGLTRIRQAHVCVVGLGGVGSWAVEALARSGVGKLTLIDLDDVCVSNINRQIHALTETVGKPKTAVMADRVRAIHPDCEVVAVQRYVSLSNLPTLITSDMGMVFDAIDALREKCALIAHCREQNIRCITAGGAGGRTDPTLIEIKDLSRSFNDPLLLKVRKTLRREYGFSRNRKKKFRIDCVFSPEPIRYPWADGSVCDTREPGSETGLNCDAGFGTAAYLTGAFGLAAAAHIIREIASQVGNLHSPASAGQNLADPSDADQPAPHRPPPNCTDD